MRYTNSKSKRNRIKKDFVPITLLLISFFAASLLVSMAVGGINNASAGNSTTAGNSTAAGSHANNETSTSGHLTSIPGTSQVEDRRHAPA